MATRTPISEAPTIEVERLRDGGLVIDLSPMKGIRVDPAARTARAEAEFPEHCTTRIIGRRRWPRRNGASTERSSTPATAR
jgi:hypothetical protein